MILWYVSAQHSIKIYNVTQKIIHLILQPP